MTTHTVVFVVNNFECGIFAALRVNNFATFIALCYGLTYVYGLLTVLTVFLGECPTH